MHLRSRSVMAGVVLLAACGTPQPRVAGVPPADKDSAAAADSVADAEFPPADLPAIDTETPPIPDEIPEQVEEDEDVEVDLGRDPLGLARLEDEPVPVFPLEMNERVEAWIHYFQNVITDRFGLYLDRLGRYEGMIRARLRGAGLPEDLIYLSLIESGMSPNAVSRASAVGMWQFIRSTGRSYGLEVSFWVDERRDPEKATDAAIAYLTDLHEQFGSWYLAAAAYNGGPGRVRRGLARNNATTFWDLADAGALRSETTNYVPKIIAAATVAKDPERYGFLDIQPHAPLEFDVVTVPDATSFDVIADAAGTDIDTIRELNPQFHRRATPPDRTVELRVPAGSGERFAEAYAAIPETERVTFTYHVVRRGETLGRIAGEYRTTVSALRAANGNLHPRRLRIGRRLVIPVVGAAPRRQASAPAESAPRNADGSVTVTVRSGDTLWGIARRYSVTTQQIMAWNELENARIRPGDRLTLYP